MKPGEFWNCTYREIDKYLKMQLTRSIDDLKRNIQLEEASTNKLIRADAMSNRHPKLVTVQEQYPKLFNKNKMHFETPEEITRKMRSMT